MAVSRCLPFSVTSLLPLVFICQEKLHLERNSLISITASLVYLGSTLFLSRAFASLSSSSVHAILGSPSRARSHRVSRRQSSSAMHRWTSSGGLRRRELEELPSSSTMAVLPRWGFSLLWSTRS